MPKNITYLIGAGASANALPVVSDFFKNLKAFYDSICSGEFANSKRVIKMLDGSDSEYTIPNVLSMLNTRLDKIRPELGESSIDTLAKRYFLKKEYSNLRDLKLILSFYFVCEQLIKPPDYRYDVFYASLLNQNLEIPNNVKILSWNYDSQFEIAYSKYKQINNVSSIQNNLSTDSKNSSRNLFQPKIFKINGEANFSKTSPFYNYYNDFDVDTLSEILRNFLPLLISNNQDNHDDLNLSYSWENLAGGFYDKIDNLCTETEILVVIGYSYPFFNRVLDNRILYAMKNLEKIVIQDRNPDSVKERIDSFIESRRGIKLIPKSQCEQFHIPNEL